MRTAYAVAASAARPSSVPASGAATDPVHVVAIVTRESIEELGLKPGMPATAVVKATSVMVER